MMPILGGSYGNDASAWVTVTHMGRTDFKPRPLAVAGICEVNQVNHFRQHEIERVSKYKRDYKKVKTRLSSFCGSN